MRPRRTATPRPAGAPGAGDAPTVTRDASATTRDAPPAVADRHAAIHTEFRWHVPERFNIAQACCGRWADATPRAPAIRR